MEFEEYEEQEEDEIQLPPNYNNSSSWLKMLDTKNGGGGGYRYKECLKNHAVNIGGHALDGCGEFMAAGDEGTLDALKCAACNCHRNFHRKESENYYQPHRPQQVMLPNNHQRRPDDYLHVPPPPLMSSQGQGLPLHSTWRDDEGDVSNPSSNGGTLTESKKRYRTKFTAQQKEKMLGFAESIGWRIQKKEEAAVQKFCAENGVKRQVLKVWMHNNKHTLGKIP